MLTDLQLQRLEQFFAWYRRRVDHIEILGKKEAMDLVTPGSWGAERQLLFWTIVDSLANYWASTFFAEKEEKKTGKRGKKQRTFPNDRERFVAFLVENVQTLPIFERVMGPMVRRDFRNQGLVPHEQAAAAACGVHEESGQVRFAADDPHIETFLKHPAVAALRVDRARVARWTWGAFLYSQCRCHWVHRLDGSPLTRHWDGLELRDVPYYENLIDADPERDDSHPACVPVVFLFRVCREAIDTFERRCLAEERVPRHQDEDEKW